MSSGPAGFYKAPVCKAFLAISAGTSLISIYSGTVREQWQIGYQALFEERQLWRLLPCTVAFHTLPEAIFGLFLLYFFRVFERQLSSSKYAFFLLFTTASSALLQALTIFSIGHFFPEAVNSDPEDSPLSWLGACALPTSGPYGFIFASFVLYALDVPSTQWFTVFARLRFSEKALVYVAGVQLLLSSSSHSIVPGLCGVCAGLAYWTNLLGIRNMKMPAAVVEASSHYFSFLLSSPPTPSQPPAALRPRLGQPEAALQRTPANGAGIQQAFAAPPNGAAAFPASRNFAGPIIQPSSRNLEQLMAMGFDRDAATQALVQSGNDLTLATNLLLES